MFRRLVDSSNDERDLFLGGEGGELTGGILGGVSECLGASVAGGESSCEVLVGTGFVQAGGEGDEVGGSGKRGGVEVGCGVGVGGDDAGVSGGSGSSEAICCTTWSSSAGNDVEGSWSSAREPFRSLLLVDPTAGRLFRPSPGDLTNRSTSDGRAFNVGRRPNMVLSHSTFKRPKVAAGETTWFVLPFARFFCEVLCGGFGFGHVPPSASHGKMSVCTS